MDDYQGLDLDALREFLLHRGYIDCGIKATRDDKLFCLHLAEACGFKIGFDTNQDLIWRYVYLSGNHVHMCKYLGCERAEVEQIDKILAEYAKEPEEELDWSAAEMIPLLLD